MAYVIRSGKILVTVAQTSLFAKLPSIFPALRCSYVVFDFKKTLRYVYTLPRTAPLSGMLLYDDKSGSTNDQIGGDLGDY